MSGRLVCALLCASLVVSLCPTPAAGRSETARARALAARGSRLFEQGKNDQAIEAFEAAYRLKPHYLIQCNIARCHEQSGRHAAAARHYRRCLDEGGDKAPIAGEVRKSLAEAERRAPPDQGTRPPPPPPPPPRAPARPVERPFVATAALGAAMEMHLIPSQLKIATGFGYHFSGTTAGPALGLGLQLGVTADFVSLVVGPAFSWDFLVAGSDGLGFYISPVALLGFSHLGERCINRTPCSPGRSGVSLQLGAEARLLLARRWLVTFRPFSVDVLITANGDAAAGARYDLMLGGGVVF